jgi:FkbM family methyltransferase
MTKKKKKSTMCTVAADKVTKIQHYSGLVAIKTKDEQIMCVNPNDQYISRQLIAMGEWEPHIRMVLQSLVKPGMCVLDVGANIGSHTLLCSKLVGAQGQVLAFEPCKLNHDILVHNLIINKCSNTSVYKYGVGDHAHSMYIQSKWNESDKVDNYGCVVLQTNAANADDECISIITIDQLGLERCDLMKIDAEEMEDKVLAGCTETFKRCKPKLIIEIHEGDKPKVLPLLESLRYKTQYIGGIDYLAIPLV